MIYVLALEDGTQFEGQLQFKVQESLLLQKLQLNDAMVNKMESKEEIAARIQLSCVKKEILIRSALERPFELEQLLSKIGLKNVFLRIFANPDLIVIPVKINDCAHKLTFHSDDMKFVTKYLKNLNQHLGKDIVFELSEKKSEKIDKHEALMDEIIAVENEQVPSEINTDRAFLLSY